MKFSIIVPAYNVEKYIKDCILSVVRQTYNNWEVIVIDDGSKDDTLRILKTEFNENPNVFIIHTKNGGLSVARNLGIAKSKGDYILFLDGDDLYDHSALEQLYIQLKKDHLPEVLAFTARSFEDGDLLVFNKNDDYYQRPQLNQGQYLPIEYYNLSTRKKLFVGSACLMVYRKDVFEKYHLLFKDNIIHEDELFTRQLLFNISSISFYNIPVYYRRNRVDSISKSTDSELRVKSLIIIVHELLALNRKHNSDLLRRDIIDLVNRVEKIISRRKKFLLNLGILINFVRLKLLKSKIA